MCRLLFLVNNEGAVAQYTAGKQSFIIQRLASRLQQPVAEELPGVERSIGRLGIGIFRSSHCLLGILENNFRTPDGFVHWSAF